MSRISCWIAILEIISSSWSFCYKTSTDIPESLSLATPPYLSSLLAGSQGYISYPHRAAVSRFELVARLLLGHVRGSIGDIAYDLFPASPAVSCSSNLDSFRYGKLVAVQLLLCGVLPPGLIQNCSQHSCVVAINLIFHPFSQRPYSASTKPYRHNRCLEETAFHFIVQVWLPFDR